VAADLISEVLLAMISPRTKVAPFHQSSILTASEIADILRISKSKAYRMIQQGEIPAVQFDRTTRVRRQDLDEFVMGHVK
jgi:excisionase family DNA binding protein